MLAEEDQDMLAMSADLGNSSDVFHKKISR